MNNPATASQRAFIRDMAPHAKFYDPSLGKYCSASGVMSLSFEQAQTVIVRCKAALNKWLDADEQQILARFRARGKKRGKRPDESARGQAAPRATGRRAGYGAPTQEMRERNLDRVAELIGRL